MKNLIRLSDYGKEGIKEVFSIADDIRNGKYKDFLNGKTVVMFFPSSSIRTRITFEKGVYLLGGQTILFPPETLDKKEKLCDVAGYLNNWADAVVIRHKNISILDEFSLNSRFPIINAMTDINHPCEMLSDMYALSKLRENFTKDIYLFVGAKGNIGLAWKEASEAIGFKLIQCCPRGYEMDGVDVIYDLEEAIKNIDIVCTDPLSKDMLADFYNHQVTKSIMQLANKNALLNPCPPFYREEEVSSDAIESDFFVGYEFKKYLLEIQQAVIIYNLTK